MVSMEDRAQISAELLIIMAAVVGFSLLLVQNLSSTSGEAVSKLNESTDELMSEIDNITG